MQNNFHPEIAYQSQTRCLDAQLHMPNAVQRTACCMAWLTVTCSRYKYHSDKCEIIALHSEPALQEVPVSCTCTVRRVECTLHTAFSNDTRRQLRQNCVLNRNAKREKIVFSSHLDIEAYLLRYTWVLMDRIMYFRLLLLLPILKPVYNCECLISA